MTREEREQIVDRAMREWLNGSDEKFTAVRKRYGRNHIRVLIEITITLTAEVEK